MPRFRSEKERLMSLCLLPDWKTRLQQELAEPLPGAAATPLSVSPARPADALAVTGPERAKSLISPLLALLSRPECRWQAAYALGLAVPLLAKGSLEEARVIMRRLMWSLNEESGNLGWGVPEAMACILAHSPALAGEYARILLSYGYETGKDDNFLDHAPLRRGVFWGMGYLALANLPATSGAVPHLIAALHDEDRPIRFFAAWALGVMAEGADRLGAPLDGRGDAGQALRAALEKEKEQPLLDISYFDGKAIVEQNICAVMETALQRLGAGE